MERKIQGRPVPEEQLDEWVAEAEKGYDPAWLKKRMGRPARSSEAAELAAVMARADRDHLNRSEAIRQALAEWAAAS